MVNAVVLINVDRGHVNEVAERLVSLDGVTEVFSVAGRYDLVAVLRTAGNERIADLVTRQIMEIERIASTETLLAFKVFSSYDLERMFSIGLEPG
jgi:DNA-binding Lrp family transcriptional regulator